MKLLDPFAGYRLAQGHPIFHLAFFCGSWIVTYYKDEEQFYLTRGDICNVFTLLRWVHFAVFFISILSGWADTPSQLLTENYNKGEDEKRKLNEILHRDSKWRTFSKFLDTLSLFMYQGSVFFAQWTLVTSEQCIKVDANNWDCNHLVGAEATWIVIETISFYAYMMAASVYIL